MANSLFNNADHEATMRRIYSRDPGNVTPEFRAFFDAETQPTRDAEEQQRIADRTRRAENEKREQEQSDAEAHAHVTQTDILPRSLQSLKSLPTKFHDQYEKQYDGTFRLAFVYVDDAPNFLANMDDISSGKLIGRPRGYKPGEDKKRAEANEKQAKDILKQIDDEAAAAREARIEAERQEAVRKVNARFGR